MEGVPASVCNGPMHIDRIDPADLDLDTADAIAALGLESQRHLGLDVTTLSGPARLKLYQHSSDGTPFAGVWVARDGEKLLGYASAHFPTRDNTDSAHLSGAVAVGERRTGIGRALCESVTEHAAAVGRHKVYSGALEGSDGVGALSRLGFRPLHTYAINSLDVHGTSRDRWQRLYDDAAAVAEGYELVRLVGRTPDERVADVVALFDAINDAPQPDPDAEPDRWTADRVRAYDEAMAARRQTVYRVMARHRESGAWAGHTVLCIDEFDPVVGHQEDTSVVRAHRGHRLGVLLKADLLRWIADERPELAATETWNSVENHHMLAVNELLGTTLAARYVSMRRG
jgi:GNAT superfamily N-acetyltransferase